MKINVKVEEEWFVIPCGAKKKDLIRWLTEEAVKRFNKREASRNSTPLRVIFSNVCELRLAQTNGILDGDDCVQDVLQDNDFVFLGKFINS
jgi:hypothetical protein